MPKPKCPWCFASTSTVARARPRYATLVGDEAYHRQRRCAECLALFPTVETVDLVGVARARAAIARAAARVAASLSSVLAPSSRTRRGRR